jgi:hypothetical protein
MDPSTLRATPPARGSRRALPATAAVAGVLTVLTAVTWVTGGLHAESASPRIGAPGAAIDQTRFTVRVDSARATTAKVSLEPKPVPILAVRMRVTNTGKDTVTLEDPTFGFTAGVFLGPEVVGGVGWSGKHSRLREPDDVQTNPSVGTAETVPPRMTRDVAVIWKLTGPAPPQVTVDLRDWDYRLTFDRSEYIWWADQDSPVAAKITVPVRADGAG